MREKILITGGSGLLGLNWPIYSEKKFEIILLLNKRKIRPSFAKTISLKNYKLETIKSIIEKTGPKYVLHCAAITDVDYCETKIEETEKINVQLTKYLASLCKELNIKFIFISTDQLFNGKKQYYIENERASPLNIYGKSKLKAELEINKVNRNAIIIRTNFFGWGTTYRKSFSDFIIGNLRNNKKIKLFKDVFYTPIFIGNLVELVSKLIDLDVKGIYNVCSNERLNKYQFGKILAEKFNLDLDLIEEVMYHNYPLNADRPLDMSLSNSKITKILKTSIPNLNDQLNYFKISETNPNIKELMKL